MRNSIDDIIDTMNDNTLTNPEILKTRAEYKKLHKKIDKEQFLRKAAVDKLKYENMIVSRYVNVLTNKHKYLWKRF